MNYREKYQQLLNRTEPYLFQQIWWLDTVYGDQNWRVLFNEEQGLLTDALPFGFESKWGFHLIRPALLTPYLGNINKTNLKSLLSLFQQLPDSSECIIATPPVLPEQAFTGYQHLRREKKTTYLLLLENSIEAIYDGFSKERKRHIRRANQHLQIEEQRFDVSSFISWHKRSFELKRCPYPYSVNFIEKLIDTAQKNNAVVCKQAILEGKIIAQIACFYDQNTMYYLLGAYDEHYAYYNGMSLLMYACIRDAQRMGLKTFDFEGSSDPGIARFFTKFGAEQCHYYILSKPDSLFWKLKKKIL